MSVKLPEIFRFASIHGGACFILNLLYVMRVNFMSINYVFYVTYGSLNIFSLPPYKRVSGYPDQYGSKLYKKIAVVKRKKLELVEAK
jgi:hypothetical protein